ncbi:MAG: Lrp/AsnC family transcriptional regulator [Candidatus Korarchaeota archaeon]|nr:Lrp/AsnC family transcriptional regulator [Candidatus Korarchaeota archaeon]
MASVDELDMKILEALKENARVSFRKLARELGVSPMTVVKRVKRMERAGIIKGYTVILDESKLGGCRMCVMVKVRRGYDVVDVGRRIAEIQECSCLHYIAGSYDLALMLSCVDQRRLGEVLRRIKGVEGVEDLQTNLVIDTLERRGLP